MLEKHCVLKTKGNELGKEETNFIAIRMRTDYPKLPNTLVKKNTCMHELAKSI